MPDFERPEAPETPRFQEELEGRLRMAARRPPARPLRLRLRRPDWIGMQRYLMPVGMSVMAFVVAAAFLVPGYQDQMVRWPTTTVTSAPSTPVPVGSSSAPTDEPSEPHLIDGRFSLTELAAAVNDTTDRSEAVRSFIR